MGTEKTKWISMVVAERMKGEAEIIRAREEGRREGRNTGRREGRDIGRKGRLVEDGREPEPEVEALLKRIQEIGRAHAEFSSRLP